MPELGQMLATSWAILTQPWGMVAVGSMIFITVLGFNLVGEGLRAGMNLNSMRRRSILSQVQFTTGMWLDEHVFHPLSKIFSHPVIRGTVIVGMFLALFWFGGVQFLYPRLKAVVQEIGGSEAVLAIAIQSPTPEETEANSTPTPEQEQPVETVIEPSVVFEIEHPGGFATGLALSLPENQFYAATKDGSLIAYDLEGDEIWETQLPEMPFTAVPVIDNSGTIYLTDRKAGLTAISPTGEILWHFVSDLAPNTVTAPVLSPDGVSYYVVSDFTSAHIQAVSTNGESLWSTNTESSNYYFPLSISLDGKYLFHREDVVDTQTFTHIKIDPEFAVQRVIGGLDGNNYALSGQNLISVDFSKEPPEFLGTTSWGTTGGSSANVIPITTPSEILIDADGSVRMMYTTPGGNTNTFWHQIEGQAEGISTVRMSGSTIQAFNSNSDIFLCGGRPFQAEILSCALMTKELDEEAWIVGLGSIGPGLGGFVLNDQYYFSTSGGKIFVIEELISSNQQEVSLPAPPINQGIVWSYALGEALDFGPRVTEQGIVYLITDNQILTTLNPDGTQRYSGELSKPWLKFTDSYGYTTEVYPFLLQDTLVVLAEDNTVYALEDDGSLTWEYPLEYEAIHYPTATSDHIYITDREGILYAFDRNGLHWSLVPEGPNVPTGSLAVASDGRVFYGLTDPGKGYIQALSKDGSPIWNIQARTDFFYDELEIAGNEEYLFLNDDIYQLDTGELVDVEFPFPVDDLLAGDDGKLYFRSANSIMNWQLAGNEVEILHTASLDEFVSSPFFPYVRISELSLIWVYQFSGNQFGVTWLDVDGNVVGRFTEKQNEIMYEIDDNPLKIGICTHSENILSCGSVDPVTEKFTEAANIAGVDQFLPSNFVYRDGFLYILTNDRDLIKAYIGD
jgi:hypothetical protein